MPSKVTVTVNNAAIQGMFEDTGEIGRFGQRVNRVAWGRAKALAPKDTGRLAASINLAPAAGKLQYHITVYSRLGYADWVNHGTTGPILPKHSSFLSVFKRNPTGKYPKIRYEVPPRGVRGQRGQYFLESGIEQAMAGTGIIIGIRR